jgi:hypothetical protein
MKPLPGLLAEAVLVVAAGAALGWAGNALSPRGLRVDRDYFPRAAETGGGSDGSSPAAAAGPGASDADPAQAEAFERLRARGLVPIAFAEARALYEDPLYAAGAYVFLDARHDEDHALGHIPGARVFDHYHMERYLADVLALAPGTMRMVVYCSGGVVVAAVIDQHRVAIGGELPGDRSSDAPARAGHQRPGLCFGHRESSGGPLAGPASADRSGRGGESMTLTAPLASTRPARRTSQS